jgi:presenilin-like A22 family membrane protease
MKLKDLSMASMLLLVVAVQILSLAMTPALKDTDIRIFEDPSETMNAVYYFLMILIFTAFMLIALKAGRKWVIEAVILISVVTSIYYVLSAFSIPIIAAGLAIAMTALLRSYPEWYIVDCVGLLVCAGVSSLFGISMSTLPALVLLCILAVYDAVSVYKTKHMVSLAEGAINIRAPLLFVVPKRLDYSFIRDGRMGKGNGAYFLGLGDAIIPTVLVVSANQLQVANDSMVWFGVNGPALGAMLGTCLGFAVLATTSRDRPHAGLPFLNGGAILGFLIGCAASGVPPF